MPNLQITAPQEMEVEGWAFHFSASPSVHAMDVRHSFACRHAPETLTRRPVAQRPWSSATARLFIQLFTSHRHAWV